MSTPAESWKNWEGRVVDGKFSLRQFLGSSDHSAVFLTERSGLQKAVIKLVRAENPKTGNLNEDAQLSRWASAARLSHLHLIRLFESGRCTIDGAKFLYVVMEYAEENLAEILPLRPLTPAEVSEMLRPTAGTLAFLHEAGLAHGRIRPSNIMAVDNQLKISADGLGKIGELIAGRAPSGYDAPELASSGLSPAADVWSLGVTLVAVLTQNEPKLLNSNVKPGDQGRVAVPESIPQPFREIARQCLQVDPQQRCTATDIVSQLQTPKLKIEPRTGKSGKIVDSVPPKEHFIRRFAIPVVVAALFLLAWMGTRFISHQPPVPPAETHATTATPPAEIPPPKSPEPVSESKKPAHKGVVRGSVLKNVLPEVSRSAQNTITGRVKVSVQVSVDASGNVSQAKLVSAGPSKYFADRALAAAHGWKFTPPQVDGEAAASEWILRFQYGRASTEVFPSETKP